jgi:hypothetical protein
MTSQALTARSCAFLLTLPSILPPLIVHVAWCWVQAICTEAGLLALRERRMRVTQADFRQAKDTALHRKKGEFPEGLYL